MATSRASKGGSKAASKPDSGARSARAEAGRPGDAGLAALRLVLLYGEERYLQTQFLADLKGALEEAFPGGFDTVRFDAAPGGTPASSPGGRLVTDVLDECRSMGLLAAHKLVLVENADIMLKDKSEDESGGGGGGRVSPKELGRGRRMAAPMTAREMMEAYAQDPATGATLVLRASKWNKGKLDKAVEALGERGRVMECDALREGDARAWAIEQAARHNTRLEPEAAALLVGATGADLGRIDAEIEKLAVAAGEGEPITRALVETMTGITREDEFWAIQSRLLSANTGEVLRFLHQLLEVSRADTVPLTWSYIDLARKIHAVSRALSQGMPENRALGAAKVWGPGSERVLECARRIKPELAVRMFKAAIEADAAGKSGGGEPVRNLDTLSVRMCAALSAKGR